MLFWDLFELNGQLFASNRLSKAPWDTIPSQAAKMRNDVVDLWHRQTAEEAVYAILVLIDSAVPGWWRDQWRLKMMDHHRKTW